MLAPFDSLDDVPVSSPQHKTAQLIVHAMIHENGQPITSHNEAKIINPTISALGIARSGSKITFENADADMLEKILRGAGHPDWLTPSTSPPEGFVIPEASWRAALELNLPLVVLDNP